MSGKTAASSEQLITDEKKQTYRHALHWSKDFRLKFEMCTKYTRISQVKIDCEHSLFYSEIRGEEQKTSESARSSDARARYLWLRISRLSPGQTPQFT